jgi:hypothetical protein
MLAVIVGGIGLLVLCEWTFRIDLLKSLLPGAVQLAGKAERWRSVGMDDYLSKPASLSAMQAVIRRWLPGAPSKVMIPEIEPMPFPAGFNAIAHKLKSSAASVGASGVAELCAAIETASQANETEKLIELATAFQTEMSALTKQLESYLVSSTAPRRMFTA